MQDNRINILILPTVVGMTAIERAHAVNHELFKIQRPIAQQKDVSQGLFMSFANVDESVDKAVIIGQRGYVIQVHPDHDLTGLFELFPDLSELEKRFVQYFLNTRSFFYFEQILPQFTEYLDDVQMREYLPDYNLSEV
jgi:hypothetical protein